MKENKEIPIGARFHCEIFKDEGTGKPSQVEIKVNNEKEAAEIIRAFWDAHDQVFLEEEKRIHEERMKRDELYGEWNKDKKFEPPNYYKDLSDEQLLDQLTLATSRTFLRHVEDKLIVIIRKNGGRGLTEEAIKALKKLGFNLGV